VKPSSAALTAGTTVFTVTATVPQLATVQAFSASGALTFGQTIVSVLSGGNNAFIEGFSIAPFAAQQGFTGVPMLQLGLRTDGGTGSWRELRVKLAGSASDVPAVGLMRDNASQGKAGFFDFEFDTLLATAAFSSSGAALLRFSTETLASTRHDYFVLVQVSSNAAIGNSFRVVIESTAAFTISGVSMASQPIYPIQSAQANIEVPRSFSGDTHPPESIIFNPSPFQEVFKLDYIQGQAFDDITVNRVLVSIRNNQTGFWWSNSGAFWTGAQSQSTATWTPPSWTLFTGPSSSSLVAGSSYTIYSQAVDDAGNFQTLPHSVTVKVLGGEAAAGTDLEPPVSDIEAPSDQSSVEDLTNIFGSASDNVAVQEVRLSIRENQTGLWWNGASWSSGGQLTHPLPAFRPDRTMFWKFPGPTRAFLLNSSSYTIYAQASDASRNVENPPAEATVTLITVQVGESSPTAKIDRPFQGARLIDLHLIDGPVTGNVGAVKVAIERQSDRYWWDGPSLRWIVASSTPHYNFAALSGAYFEYLGGPAAAGLTGGTSYTLYAQAENPSRTLLQTPPSKVTVFAESTAPATGLPTGDINRGDVTPPSTFIQYPNVGDTFLTTLGTISGSAFDNSAVAQVFVAIQRESDKYWWAESGVWGPSQVSQIAKLSAPNTASTLFSYSALPDSYLTESSSYTISVWAKDTSGNVQSPPIRIPFTFGGQGAAVVKDTAPPAQVTNLVAVSTSAGLVQLTWTAPGDDGASGTAAFYHIHVSSVAPITDRNFFGEPGFNYDDKFIMERFGVADIEFSPFNQSPPVPVAGGTPQSAVISNLKSGRSYYFAVKAADEQGNLSRASNSPAVTLEKEKAQGDGIGTAGFTVDGASSPAKVPVCSLVSATMTFVSTVSYSAGGLIAMQLPQGWSFPQTYDPNLEGYVTASSTSAATIAVTLLPNLGGRFVGALVQSGALNAAEEVRLVYRNGFAPPAIQSDKVLIFSRGSWAGELKKISAEPTVQGVVGQARRLDYEDFNLVVVGANQLSPRVAFKGADHCGNKAVPSAPKPIALRGLNASFAPDSGVLFSTSPAQFDATASSAAVVFLSSSNPTPAVYFKSDSAGQKFLEASFLDFEQGLSTFTITRSVQVKSADIGFAAGSLLLDAGTGAGAKTLTLTPDGDGVNDFAYIRFKPSDSSFQWHVAIAPQGTTDFSDAVANFFGFGDPGRSVIWDGRTQAGGSGFAYAGFAGGGSVVSSGTYRVLVEASGGIVKDTATLSITVVAINIGGKVYVGAGNSTPAEGALVTASGGGVYRSATTDSSGYYSLNGLKAGTTYFLSAQYYDYAAQQNYEKKLSVAAPASAADVHFEAPAQIRVSATLPDPAPFELWGNVKVNNANFTRQGFGTLHFPAGGTISDSGAAYYAGAAQLASVVGQSTWTAVTVQPDTYTVTVEVFGFDAFTTSVAVVAGEIKDITRAFTRAASLYGKVTLPAIQDFGTQVSVEATLSGQTFPSYWGSVFIPGKQNSDSAPRISGIYSLFNVTPGAYALKARAFGFDAVSTGPVVVANVDLGTPDRGGVDFPPFSTGGVLEGTVTVKGDSTRFGDLTLYINAFNARTFSSAFTRVILVSSTTLSSSTFRIGGLTDGAYQLTTFLDGFVQVDPATSLPGVQTATVSGGTGKANLVLQGFTGQARLHFLLPSGSADYDKISLTVNGPGVFISTSNVTTLAGDGGRFDVWSTSATLLTPPNVGTGFYDIAARYATTGKRVQKLLNVVNGKVATAEMDLRGETYDVGGSITLASAVNLNFSTYSVTVNKAADLAANAVQNTFCSGGFRVCVTTSSFRMELYPRGFDNFSSSITAATAGGGSAVSYFSAISASGNYLIRNVPPGTYLLRNNPELDGSFADGTEVAPVEQIITVRNSSATANFTFTSGHSVSGVVALPVGTIETRDVIISLRNTRGEAIQSKTLSFVGASSAAYSFTQVANGGYIVEALDGGSPVKYTAKPFAVTMAGSDLTGRNLSLEVSGVIQGKINLRQVSVSGSTTTVTLIPITANNNTLLPGNFALYAQANPWVEGGFSQAGQSAGLIAFDSFNQFTITGLVAGTYDVVFAQGSAAGDVTARGSFNLAPVVISGVRVAAGQIKDVGTVLLRPGQNVIGRVLDSQGNPLPNIEIIAEPSSGSGSQSVVAQSDSQGGFLLGGLDPGERYYDFTAARRVGLEESNQARAAYAEKYLAGVDITVKTSGLDISLTSAPSKLSCQVTSGDGGELLWPDADRQGLAAAKVFIQKTGVRPRTNPVGDVIIVTGSDGSFVVNSLEAAKYKLTVAAQGYKPAEKAVELKSGANAGCSIELASGITLTGTMVKPNGSNPSQFEIASIAAVNVNDIEERFVGSLESPGNSKVVTKYAITGFRAGRTYKIIFTDDEGDTLVPTEGEAVTFSTGTTVQTLNLIYKPRKPEVSAVIDVSKTSAKKFSIVFNTTKRLRNKTSDDEVASSLVSASSGVISGAEISNNRKKLTLELNAEGTSISSITVRFFAYSNIENPASTDTVNPEFAMETQAVVFIGIDAVKETPVSNLSGGTARIGGDDPSKVELPVGTFAVDASSTIKVGIQKANENPAATRQRNAGYNAGGGSYGLKFAPAAYPAGFFKALAAADALPNVNPFSAFYDIFLPLGVRTSLNKPSELTLHYDSTTVSDPGKLNVYWFNESANTYVLQQDVLGGLPGLDSVNNTVKINVDHFSTFVLLDAKVAVISSTAAVTSAGLDAYNFPNPFDLRTKTVSMLHGVSGGQTADVRGTMIYFSVPAGMSGDGKIDIFNVAGEKVRSIALGALNSGIYYQAWNGQNDSGRDVASGVYIAEIKVGGSKKFIKMAVIK
ncbi:MAG: hypothetical protein HY611_04735, partial [Elusimicrobia bacterium]|nr:hypothetical protein [Elusimicrobiota bacterium]